ELGLRGDVVLSEFRGHLAQAAGDNRDSLLVVIGGDGTVNEGANGIAGTDAEIAVLPGGTGQDFGRTHGIPSRFDDAVRVELGGETRTIELGRVGAGVGGARGGGGRPPPRGQGEWEGADPRLFANVGSAGMSGAVARRANA